MTVSRRVRVGWGLWAVLVGLGAAPARATQGASPTLASPAPLAGAALTPEAPAPAALDGLAGAGAARPDGAFLPTEIEQIWRRGLPLPERVEQAQSAAREFGVANFDAPARALLRDAPPGRRLGPARDAVGLAPDLPLARLAYARALWQEEHAAWAALRSVVVALGALGRHLEASLWLGANALHGLGLALFWGGSCFLAVAFARNVRTLAHDLGDRLSLETPAFGRVLLLGSVVLAPAACGAGWLGLAVGLFGASFAWGDANLRRSLIAAAIAIGVGLHPVLRLAGGAIAALSADPVALAAYAVETETASAPELVRLARAENDPLAARALAVRARRSGDLAAADVRYGRLLSSGLAEPSLVNNAANVRLALGDVRGAISLYERVSSDRASPVVLFNLSHAYGAAIRPDAQDEALSRAQALDADMIGALTDLMANEHRGQVVDLPYSLAGLRARLVSGPAGAAVAAELRHGLAPGALGGSAVGTVLAFALAAAAALLAARGHPASRRCAKCGVRRCPRCDDPSESRTLCDACARSLHRPDAGDPAQRAERLAALRASRRRLERAKLAADLALPGAAGVLADRPLLGALGAIVLVGAALALGLGDEIVVDPLAAGEAGSVARACAALALALGHAGLVAFARAHRRD